MSVDLVYALHGFLGEASDWNAVKKHLNSNIEFLAPSFFGEDEINFELIKSKKGKKIFLGYSLGARIGLQQLSKPENQNIFEHMIFVSCNAGYANDDVLERNRRIQSDQSWANKITEANWSSFIQEWNAQEVFSASVLEPRREVQHYKLRKLKNALVEWSLGNQKDCSSFLQEHQSKISWVVGEKDKKFLQLALNLKAQNIINEFISLEGGHRLHLDNPLALAKIVNSIY